MKVTPGLKRWFFIHFIADLLIALPLIFLTARTLVFFGFLPENLVLARILGAGLLGIGGASLFTRGKKQYEIMLILKMVWSVSAIIILIWGILETGNYWLWLFVAMFVAFLSAWIYYETRK
ncbi:MAG: hypothetical protein KJ597_04970 [Nanoarchaeota archaeon]|nr:hypothetical protein [Nanoarchaeota archaeon]MBU1622897.1 hypothetical protein [Nanoarchaeota archaeon]